MRQSLRRFSFASARYQPLSPLLVGSERLRSFCALMTQVIEGLYGNSQRTKRSLQSSKNLCAFFRKRLKSPARRVFSVLVDKLDQRGNSAVQILSDDWKWLRFTLNFLTNLFGVGELGYQHQRFLLVTIPNRRRAGSTHGFPVGRDLDRFPDSYPSMGCQVSGAIPISKIYIVHCGQQNHQRVFLSTWSDFAEIPLPK